MLLVLQPRNGRAFLITEKDSGHCIVMKRWMLYVSYCPSGISKKEYPFRRISVCRMWMIENPIEQLRLQFGESRKRFARALDFKVVSVYNTTVDCF
jgi:hypothetical protein